MNTEDLNFAYKVRHALNEQLDQLPPSTEQRLASARKIALSRKKAHAPAGLAQAAFAAAGSGHFFAQPLSWMTKMGVALPLLLLAGGMVGIYQFEQEQHIAEIAELDTAVLADELPLSAYLDHGFNAYLTQRGQ